MIHKKIYVFLLCLLFCCACTAPTTESATPIKEVQNLADVNVPASFDPLPDGCRDNTPLCLVPLASEVILYSNQLATIDASNAQEGYIMVRYHGINEKVKLQITGPDQVTYTYNLSTTYEAFPLSAGSGTYTAAVFENIAGTKYSTVLSSTFDVDIQNTFGPNLYPNQYVNFDIHCQVVSYASELAKDCTNDLQVVENVYNFVSKNITYDHDKASNVQSGYTTNVDEIFLSHTGICLDYAAVMTSMLRSQRIPTRLEVGYAGSAYHAWISTYIKDVGWINGIIHFNGESWSLMDPTFAANSSEQALKNFIGDGSNYMTKYIY